MVDMSQFKSTSSPSTQVITAMMLLSLNTYTIPPSTNLRSTCSLRLGQSRTRFIDLINSIIRDYLILSSGSRFHAPRLDTESDKSRAVVI